MKIYANKVVLSSSKAFDSSNTILYFGPYIHRGDRFHIHFFIRSSLI